MTRKDIILKIHSSSIVSPQNKEDEGTPNSNIPLASEDRHVYHSLQQQDTLLSTTRWHPSTQHHSSSQNTPPSQNPPPPAQPLPSPQHHSP
jgi:hypothetical protein